MKPTKKIIEEHVLNYLLKHKIPAESRILTAYSGGPDSTVLTAVLAALPNYNFKITAAYFNHRLRPAAELAAEELIIMNQSAKLGVECVIGSAEVGEIKKAASDSGLSIEEAARNARYSFLEDTRKKSGADFIALGHNLNDNTETMLMRFFQNAGTGGLSGIPEKRNCIIRPLCGVPRSLIEDYIAENRLEISVDGTNLEKDFLRNKIRHDIIPEIRNVFPEIDKNLAGLAEKFRLDNEFIQQEAEKKIRWTFSKGGWSTPAGAFYDEHSVIRIRSIFSIINRLCGAGRISYRAVSQAVENRTENGKILLEYAGIEIFTANDLIFVRRLVNRLKKSYLLNLEYENKVSISEHNFIVFDPDSASVPEADYNKCLIETAAESPLILRSHRDGDRIKTTNGTKSLKKLFNEWKVRIEDRCHIPIVEDTNGISAIIGRPLGYKNITADNRQFDECGSKKIMLYYSNDTEITGER